MFKKTNKCAIKNFKFERIKNERSKNKIKAAYFGFSVEFVPFLECVHRLPCNFPLF